MTLKLAVHNKIMEEVIRSIKGSDWKVLVVDTQGMRIISSCCKMTEIMSEGITLVEDLNKRREPLPLLDAIYLIAPVEKSIRSVMLDFQNSSRSIYRCAHIFFTQACPEILFNHLCKSNVSHYIKTLKEINIAFLPYEKQVFHLDASDSVSYFFTYGRLKSERHTALEKYAEQVATLCATLSEYPSLRYKADSELTFQFANLLQEKLTSYKADDHTMGQGSNKEKSLLLILDRGFDPVSAILHELTLQAMAYDLLPITNDVYVYDNKTSGESVEKQVLLDEKNDLWVEMRHKHIAVVSQQVTRRLKEFTEVKRMSAKDKASMKDLSQMIKMMPQYQKELTNYSTHLNLAEDCMKRYQMTINKLCKVEQDLAMGTDADGEKVKDQMKNIVPILLDQHVGVLDKCRIILLYAIHKGGISEENLNKLIEHAQIPSNESRMIRNIQNLGVSIIQEPSNKKKLLQSYLPQNRKEKSFVHQYQMSRWVPFLKDIIEDMVEERLDITSFPYLTGIIKNDFGSAPLSARYGQWHMDKNQSLLRSINPRIIIFILGGVTYSEIRSVYEVATDAKNWDIVIGSTHVITPTLFMDSLSDL